MVYSAAVVAENKTGSLSLFERAISLRKNNLKTSTVPRHLGAISKATKKQSKSHSFFESSCLMPMLRVPRHQEITRNMKKITCVFFWTVMAYMRRFNSICFPTGPKKASWRALENKLMFLLSEKTVYSVTLSL